MPRLALILIGLLPIHPASLNETQLGRLAKELVPLILSSRQTIPLGTYLSAKVLVVDLSPDSGPVDGVGTLIADRLAESLIGLDSHVELVDRKQLHTLLEATTLTAADFEDPAVQRWAWSELRVNTIVTGHYRIEEGRVQIRLEVRRVSDGKSFGALDGQLERSKEIEEILHKARLRRDQEERAARQRQIEETEAFVAACEGIAQAGTMGISHPSCQHCPNPPWSETARKFSPGKREYRVVLAVVVSVDGRITRIRVIRGAPYGLTEVAAKQVESWKLRPAKGSDGKSQESCTQVEINFRWY